jgi:hypothetical protein
VDNWVSYRKAWRHALTDYTKVLIFVDGDAVQADGKQPGKDMARAIAEDLKGRGRLVLCDEGEDVSSMVASGRLEQLRERMGL